MVVRDPANFGHGIEKLVLARNRAFQTIRRTVDEMVAQTGLALIVRICRRLPAFHTTTGCCTAGCGRWQSVTST